MRTEPREQTSFLPSIYEVYPEILPGRPGMGAGAGRTERAAGHSRSRLELLVLTSPYFLNFYRNPCEYSIQNELLTLAHKS